MSEHSESYEVTGNPMLDADGVTIWQRYGGKAPEGYFYDGWHKIEPGDPRYDELLPQARRNPRDADDGDDLDDDLDDLDDLDDEEGESTVHPETMAMLMDMQRRTRERDQGR
ncbi:hypothetical protein [Streptomyces sp. NRRL S-350]|uniref:hypothetical protein n=1 Tax=Streptomyces sp. NRRL S-350 TaxID=1463902 RepID=UPI0004BF5171|nr:hypothetical protein [Streptomyces sp. NRRL S-350]